MTELNVDRELRDLFGSMPRTAPLVVVDRAIDQARDVTQRHPVFTRLDVRAWPPPSRSMAVPGVQRSLRAVRIIAAAVLLLATAVAVGSELLERHTFDPTNGQPLAAVFVHTTSAEGSPDVEVAVAGRDGVSRVVARFPATLLPEGWAFSSDGRLSRDGLLAVAVRSPTGDDHWALFDVSQPHRPPFLIPTNHGPTSGWSPTGLFGTGAGSGIFVTDGRTGATTGLGSLSLPGAGPNIIWAADGSGIVVGREPDLALMPLDGGPLKTPVPAIAAYRWLAGGERLRYLCTASSAPCRAAVPIQVHDGTTTVTWYDGRLLGPPVDMAFSADGKALWLLFLRPQSAPASAVIARASAPGVLTVAATVTLDPLVTDAGPGFAQ